MTKGFTGFLVDRDIYGMPITVLYKGSDAFKTRFGATFTLLTYVLLLINIISLTESFFNGSRQDESSQTVLYDRYSAG